MASNYGYEDGEVGGEPLCPSYDEGLEFIDEEKVYVIDEGICSSSAYVSASF